MLTMKSIALALALCGASSAALAQSSPENYGGYLRATDGSVVRSGAGLCWRTGSWTPETQDASCDTMVAVADRVEAVPAPAPALPAPAAEPAAARVVELSAAAHFAFDSDRLSQAGKAELDAVARKARDGRVEVAMVTGHTDRIGSEAYNHGLAQRRARAAADYLASIGFEADKIQVQERGESEPLVQCDQRGRKALIRCLAPNRRAEILIRFAE